MTLKKIEDYAKKPETKSEDHLELEVNWNLTFSCYNDKDGIPCGECAAFIKRGEAFSKVEFEDTIYTKELLIQLTSSS